MSCFPDRPSRAGRVLQAGVLVFFLLQLVLVPACSMRIFGGRANIESIAVVPFDNFTENPKIPALIMPKVIKELSDKGVKIAPQNDLMQILLENRVRSFAYISSDLAREIGEKLQVQAVLIGCVVYAKDTRENPQIGLTSRLIDTASGRVLWADYVSLSGREFKSVLGLGEITKLEKLMPKSVEALFASFEAHYRHMESKYKVAVMPFKNHTENKAAGPMITSMFIVELFKRGHFEVVELGDVRRAVVDNRIRKKGELDYAKIEACFKSLNADGILLGSVDVFTDGIGSTPAVDITVRLINAHNKKILLLDSLHFSGEKDIIAFTWQELKAADKTAYQAVSKLSGKMERAKWN